ncbi:peptide-methionine (S)-S-oxide reductase [Lentisphaera marina]|uniref:peptide-methionine (S)-S-oxide reductase n=1 Tax=Lentisphaera marina TaxID=1111041 RepID=UPI002365A692|nr:peptide-methionine (S)-S-oxide reductase [Lentisphaera marina]MDD7984863.1 peptide-methionine (S)-S-oxide reductase [Lentisphaera marina]
MIISSACFWNVQKFFDQHEFVSDSICGYTGGTSASPTYENAKKDGHVEAVKITFKSEHYQDLLKFFFDEYPTKRIKVQNEMHGKKFRGRLFYHTLEEKELFEKMRLKYDDEETLTLILPAKDFYPAEDYHQNKYMKRCAKK